MPLLKETYTSRFESEHQKAIVNILFTYSWCIDRLKQLVAPYDITTQQFNILRILRGQYPDASTINLLRARMLDKMSDASRIVDRLVQKELVVKQMNSTDKRAVDILISEKGLKLLKKMDKEISVSDLIDDRLTEEEAAHLNKLLDKIRY